MINNSVETEAPISELIIDKTYVVNSTTHQENGDIEMRNNSGSSSTGSYPKTSDVTKKVN